MSQSDRINEARKIGRFAAQQDDHYARQPAEQAREYDHAGIDTGREAADALREAGPDAAAAVVAAYHLAYRASVQDAKAPTWEEEIEKIDFALPPSVTEAEVELIKDAMRKLNP